MNTLKDDFKILKQSHQMWHSESAETLLPLNYWTVKHLCTDWVPHFNPKQPWVSVWGLCRLRFNAVHTYDMVSMFDTAGRMKYDKHLWFCYSWTLSSVGFCSIQRYWRCFMSPSTVFYIVCFVIFVSWVHFVSLRTKSACRLICEAKQIYQQQVLIGNYVLQNKFPQYYK